MPSMYLYFPYFHFFWSSITLALIEKVPILESKSKFDFRILVDIQRLAEEIKIFPVF